MQLNHRDLSYSAIASSTGAKWVIRILENLTGRPAVLWRMRQLHQRVAQGQLVWDAVWDTFDLGLNQHGAPLPATGPLLVIANHPYGLVDSLALCKILSDRGEPFQVVANEIFSRAGPIAQHILPISFGDTREAARRNLETRRAALAALRAGQTVAVFPSGSTAAPPRPFRAPAECAWSSFAARIALDSGASVAPIYFPIQRRHIFDNVGFIHPTLRYGLQINGFYKHIGGTVDAHLGVPFALAAMSPSAATAKMRRELLSLGPAGTDPSVEGTRI